jgi:uncharacterized LabA/DUF88 family protein
MSSRVCVFVDGENFRHTIGNLFEDFDKMDYLPKDANWGELFDWFVEKASGNGERVRTYWYVVQHLDFFPYRFPKADKEPDALKKVLCRSDELKEELRLLEDEDLIDRMGELVRNLLNKRSWMERRFRWWTSVQNNISARHPAIEFRRAGAINYNLFDGSFGQEKAVDVKLATDLLTLSDIVDVAVIVSGDQDYVPAVQVVKDRGKKVVNVAFETRGGKLLPGGARRLNHVTDTSLQIPYSEFGIHLNLHDPTPA